MIPVKINGSEVRPIRRYSSSTVRKTLHKAILTNIALVMLFVVLFPLVWMFFSSFKSNPELYLRPPKFFAQQWVLLHYKELFLMTSFPRYFLNTFAVAGVACIVGAVVSLCGVYSLTRFRFVGAGISTFIMLLIYMLPPILLAIPFFQIWLSLGMLDTLTALMLTYLTITVPFSVWILRPYVESIPRELEESGRVDGCGQFQAFVLIIVPQTAPGVVAALIFTFVVVWNEYLYAQVIMQSDKLRTVSLAIAGLVRETAVYSWGLANAAGVMVTIPILVLFILIQKGMVSGMVVGAVKE